MIAWVLLFFLNIIFVAALWHMDVHHNLDKLGQPKTEGFFKLKPGTAYRYSQYILILTLFLIDILFILTFLTQK